MPGQFLTCAFKLHNLSRHKRDVLDHALKEYTLAYGHILERVKPNEAALMEGAKWGTRGKYTDKSVRPHLPTIPELDCAIHSTLKDSLLADVAGTLASYFTLKASGEKVSFPTARNPNPDAIGDTLKEFGSFGSPDPQEFLDAQSRLLQITRGAVMPLYFLRSDTSRNFTLLKRQNRPGLFAVLYLLPAKHSLCKKLEPMRDTLIRVDTGDVFNSRTATAILVPLELGENGWQEEKFVAACEKGRGHIKTAILIKKDNDYFLHVSFELETEVAYEPVAYLGIDKGILITAAYALVDQHGQAVMSGHLDDQLRTLQIKHGREREKRARDGKPVTKRHYRRQAYDNILHNLANLLIGIAKQHQAQIVLEDIGVQVRGKRVVSRFRELDRILAYKCVLEGLPKPRLVFAANTNRICHICGEKGQCTNYEFHCSVCNVHCHQNDNAAVNIARRALYRKADWESYWEFHKSFAKPAPFSTKK